MQVEPAAMQSHYRACLHARVEAHAPQSGARDRVNSPHTKPLTAFHATQANDCSLEDLQAKQSHLVPVGASIPIATVAYTVQI